MRFAFLGYGNASILHVSAVSVVWCLVQASCLERGAVGIMQAIFVLRESPSRSSGSYLQGCLLQAFRRPF
ncbi:hypothetical protein KC19_6G206000 [Ceratodon purpureus]|uniref:Secreted protein n=1 Tax=Ceratodon purpureus TaxID=3225 RepID=A0A8T0HJS9_CERPU|nr:hypothetical protein KC19_6G206000 [Ceratodon purpureus]